MKILPFLIDSAIIVFFLWQIRNKPRSRTGSFILAYVCLSLLFFLYSDFSRQLLSSSASIVGTLLRYLFRIMCICGFLWFRKEIRFSVALFDAAFTASILTTCSNIFMCPLLMPVHDLTVVFTGNTVIDPALCLIIKETCFFLIFAAVRYMCNIDRIDIVTVDRAAFCGLIILCNIFVRTTVISISDSQADVQSEVSYYTILLQIFIILFFIYHERFIQTSADNAALAQQELLSRLQLENIKENQKADESIRRFRHDVKNHLISIRQLAETDESAKIPPYVSLLLDDLSDTSVRINTGNVILDGILSSKLRICDRENIRTSVLLDFSEINFISNPDLVTLFGNAMDNATEACREIDNPNERFIDIKSNIAAGQLVIVISNSSKPRHRNSASLYETNKKDPLNHGFGLSNIERTANHYGGLVRADYKDGIFTLLITLPLQ